MREHAGHLAVSLVLAALGLLGFMATGFTSLLDSGGSLLLDLRVDPLQNLVHLLVGAASPARPATPSPRRPVAAVTVLDSTVVR